MPTSSTLRTWLRRSPQPASIRYRNDADEERSLKLSADARNRWRNAEEALLTAKATSVEALDEAGNVLRGTRLEVGEDGEPLDPEEAEARREERAIGKSQKELAGLIDRYGMRLNEAFREGAKASNVSHDKLVELVDILTSKLSEMISNVATLSHKLGKALQAVDDAAEPEDPSKKNDEMVASLVQLAMAKMAGMGMQPPPKQNGASNGKPSGGKGQ
jgi:hypothetical protein